MFKHNHTYCPAANISREELHALMEMVNASGAENLGYDGSLIHYRATRRQYEVFQNMLLASFTAAVR